MPLVRQSLRSDSIDVSNSATNCIFPSQCGLSGRRTCHCLSNCCSIRKLTVHGRFTGSCRAVIQSFSHATSARRRAGYVSKPAARSVLGSWSLPKRNALSHTPLMSEPKWTRFIGFWMEGRRAILVLPGRRGHRVPSSGVGNGLGLRHVGCGLAHAPKAVGTSGHSAAIAGIESASRRDKCT